ncbi:MAG TPA: ABC transporter ATP-binding protein [Microthrixaceae bacterium]|nr:ABC transporter ATP-binding protein [Microthrixaceae bacterium]
MSTSVLSADTPAPGTDPDHTQRVDRADTEPAVLALNQISKIYLTGTVEVAALRDVSLRIEPNEYVAVVGPSGSGKSTLMHILGCLDVPTSGTFDLVGHDVASLDEDHLADVRNLFIGFVFQQFNLLNYLPAWRNVELPLVYAGVSRAERKERALAALGRVGLGDRADHKPGELSGGQQQRVAIARALVTRPALILADEPTGNLDSSATDEVLAVLDGLHREGSTIVLITHEADVAARAGRTIEIRDGRVWTPGGDAAPDSGVSTSTPSLLRETL